MFHRLLLFFCVFCAFLRLFLSPDRFGATDPSPTDWVRCGGTLLCLAQNGPALIQLADNRPRKFCGSVQREFRGPASLARKRIHSSCRLVSIGYGQEPGFSGLGNGFPTNW